MLNVPQVAGVGWFCGFRSFLDSVMILLGWAAGAEANVCWTFLPLPLMQEPDTDLEVVLEKKGNMDEAHIDQVRRKALQEEIDRESGKTEASESRKCTVSLVLGLPRVARSSSLTAPSWPCGGGRRVMGDQVRPGRRGCPGVPAGSLCHTPCPELISFLLKGVLASPLESWLSEISNLNLCLWL